VGAEVDSFRTNRRRHDGSPSRSPKIETRGTSRAEHIVFLQEFSPRSYGGQMEVQPPARPLTDGVVALRPWTNDDVEAIAAACAEDEIARWLDQIPQPYTEDDARFYVAAAREGWRSGTEFNFAIVDAETAEVLGSIGVRRLGGLDEGTAETGYWVKRETRGRGIATRALRLVSRWALHEAAVERLQLRADTENIPSQRVAEQAGFVREGVLRACRFNARLNRRSDFAIYSLLPNEAA
jgi:RimJ/RimL family protein N-acetyltransferase